MATSAINVTSFTLKSSLQQPTDQWEAEIPGLLEFTLIDPDRTVDLEIGLEDSTGAVQSIRAMTSGVVDEYRLELQSNSQISHLKGRDAGAALLEEEFNTIYQRFPGQTITTEVNVIVLVGVFRAQAVAEDVIRSAGLTPMWQCRDYELWEDFDATGRKIDILQRLVDPWCSVEPSRVDIWIDGTTVYLRGRVAFPVAPDYVLAYNAAGLAPHAKCLNVNIRKERLPIYGEVSLQGREEPAAIGNDFSPPEGQPGVASNFVTIIPFQRNVDEDGGVSFTPGQLTQRSASTQYQDGAQIAIVETLSTYQIPNQVLISTIKHTYARSAQSGPSASQIANDSVTAGETQAQFTAALPGRVGASSPAEMRLIKTETKTIDYQPFTYDAKGPTNSPLPLSEFTSVESYVDETLPNGLTGTVYKRNKDETTSYSYDENNYLTTASTLERRDQDGALVNNSLVVKSYQDLGPLFFKILTNRYAFEEERGFAVNSEGALENVTRLVPKLVSTDETPVGGHRPGGPNRPPQKPLMADFGGIVSLPLSTVTTVSTEKRAENVSAGGRSMSAEDLAYIQAQHDEASGLYEAELSFTALSMPNLKRGSIIQLTGIEDEDGSGIQCATGFVPGVTGLALIYSLDLSYDEPGRRSVSDIRAVWWEPAP